MTAQPRGGAPPVGQLGGVKIVILQNRDAGKESEPDFNMFFVDGEKRQDAAANRATPPARRQPYQGRAKSINRAPELDDLWRGDMP